MVFMQQQKACISCTFLFIVLDATENMKELLQEITKKEVMATAKRMGYLNNFAQVS